MSPLLWSTDTWTPADSFCLPPQNPPPKGTEAWKTGNGRSPNWHILGGLLSLRPALHMHQLGVHVCHLSCGQCLSESVSLIFVLRMRPYDTQVRVCSVACGRQSGGEWKKDAWEAENQQPSCISGCHRDSKPGATLLLHLLTCALTHPFTAQAAIGSSRSKGQGRRRQSLTRGLVQAAKDPQAWWPTPLWTGDRF